MATSSTSSDEQEVPVDPIERALRSLFLENPNLIFHPLSYSTREEHSTTEEHLTTMAPAPENSSRIEKAQKAAKDNPSEAEALYKEILSEGPKSGEAALREYESALMGLGELYRDGKKANELAELVKTSRSTLSSFAKAKTAKLGKISCI